VFPGMGMLLPIMLSEGYHKGWPVATIVRGEVVMRDGQIVGSPSHRAYVARHPA
jgi:dihydropyrimidinase